MPGVLVQCKSASASGVSVVHGLPHCFVCVEEHYHNWSAAAIAVMGMTCHCVHGKVALAQPGMLCYMYCDDFGLQRKMDKQVGEDYECADQWMFESGKGRCCAKCRGP
jgi:hypothetical protein